MYVRVYVYEVLRTNITESRNDLPGGAMRLRGVVNEGTAHQPSQHRPLECRGLLDWMKEKVVEVQKVRRFCVVRSRELGTVPLVQKGKLSISIQLINIAYSKYMPYILVIR